MKKSIFIILYLLLFLIGKPIKADNYFIGDSRFVGMSYIDNNDNNNYYAKVGKGYSYLEKYYNEIKDKIKEDDIIIINFGINDLDNIDKYIEFVNNIESKSKIFYVTINPVDEFKEKKNNYHVKNKEIDNFNNELKENLNENIKIIDTNTYLIKNGYATNDGIHFTDSTYEKILNFIEENIK